MFSSDGNPEGEKLLPELLPAWRWRELSASLGLTKRQMEVARLICHGLSCERIAARLAVSQSVVRLHTDSLYKRLGVRNRVNAVVRLVQAGRCDHCKCLKKRET